MQEQQVLTIEEAAELLRVNPATIRAMIKRGEIVAHKVGKQFRIPRSALEKFLK